MKDDPSPATEDRARLVVRQYVEQQYRMLLQSSSEAVFLCREGKIDFVNAAAAKLFRITDRTQLLGRSFLELVEADSRQQVAQYIAEPLEGSTRGSMIEIHALRADGSAMIAELRSAFLHPDGSAVVQLAVLDVTERAQAYKWLREQYRVLETLMEDLPGMAYRRRGNVEPVMEFVSDGAFELTGYPARDFIEGTRVFYYDIVHPDDRSRVRHGLRQMRNGRFALRYRIYTGDGQTRWVYDHGKAVQSTSGDYVYWAGIIQDITAEVDTGTISV